MNPWATTPLVRPLIAIVAGISLYLFAGLGIPLSLTLLLLAATVLANIGLQRRQLRFYRLLPLAGLLFHLSLLCCGNQLAISTDEKLREDHFLHHLKETQQLAVHLTAPPQPRSSVLEVSGRVVARQSNNTWQVACGRTLLFLPDSGKAQTLKYGDVIVVTNRFQWPDGPRNPMGFDYSRYLSHQQIYTIAFLQHHQWQAAGWQEQQPLTKAIYDLRESALQTLERHVQATREVSVVQALSVGYRQNMDFTLRQMYADAGVVHVLAVSGLHVGILYASLLMLLGFLKRLHYGRLIEVIIVLAVIWLFALVCGLPASVWRAATMFSLLLLGSLAAGHINTYNILAASALLILLINPRELTDIGMQLSFAAMVGIKALYPSLNYLLARNNKLVDYIWKMMAVSTAAQVGTLPFTLYYFHQFPTYFLIANLPVIPLAALLLNLSLLLLATHVIPGVGVFIGMLVEKTTWLLNEYVRSIQMLPASVWEIPYLTITEAVLFTVFLVGIIAYLLRASRQWLLAGLAGLCAMLLVQGARLWQTWSQPEVVVYSLRRSSCLDFNLGRHIIRLASFTQLTPAEAQYLKTIHCLTGRHQPDVLLQRHWPHLSGSQRDLAYHHGFIRYRNQTGLIWTPGLELQPTPTIDVDFLVVTGMRNATHVPLLQRLRPEQVIADGTCSAAVLKSLERWCRQQGIAYADTRTSAQRISLTGPKPNFAGHP